MHTIFCANCTENFLIKNEQKRKKHVYHSLLSLKVKKFKSSFLLKIWTVPTPAALFFIFFFLFFLVLISFSLKEIFCIQLLPVSTEPISRPVYLRYLFLVLLLRILKDSFRYTRCLKLSRCLSFLVALSTLILSLDACLASRFYNNRFYIVRYSMYYFISR